MIKINNYEFIVKEAAIRFMPGNFNIQDLSCSGFSAWIYVSFHPKHIDNQIIEGYIDFSIDDIQIKSVDDLIGKTYIVNSSKNLKQIDELRLITNYDENNSNHRNWFNLWIEEDMILRIIHRHNNSFLCEFKTTSNNDTINIEFQDYVLFDGIYFYEDFHTELFSEDCLTVISKYLNIVDYDSFPVIKNSEYHKSIRIYKLKK